MLKKTDIGQFRQFFKHMDWNFLFNISCKERCYETFYEVVLYTINNIGTPSQTFSNISGIGNLFGSFFQAKYSADYYNLSSNYPHVLPQITGIYLIKFNCNVLLFLLSLHIQPNNVPSCILKYRCEPIS